MPSPEPLKEFLNSNLPQALDLLRQMVAINSFTANRDGVNRLGRFTAESFAPLGFKPQFVPATNRAWGDHLVLTRRGKSSRNLVLISHLDTVFPPEEEVRNHFHWQPDGDRIFGPGTVDIKGGSIMIWLVLRALQTLCPDLFETITWRVLWNAAEEQFSADFGELCRSLFDPQTLAALVFEAEGRRDGRRVVVVARKGRATWRVTAQGRGAHAGGKHPQGANAIVQLGQTVQQIAALTDPSRQLTFNVGTISGGTVTNRVPHDAIVEGEFRAFDAQVYAQARAALLALTGPGQVAAASDGYRCTVKTEILEEFRPWARNPGTDRLFSLWQQAGQEIGLELGSEERGGLSDGNLIWDAVPTLDGLGPWGDNDHCSERSPDGTKLPEFVDPTTFVPKAMINVRAIQRLVESDPPPRP
jgi:glutamate carboxypeptidase